MKSKAKFHISLGHETVLAKITLFHGGTVSSSSKDTFDFSPEYKYQVDHVGLFQKGFVDPPVIRILLKRGARWYKVVSMSCLSWNDVFLLCLVPF